MEAVKQQRLTETIHNSNSSNSVARRQENNPTRSPFEAPVVQELDLADQNKGMTEQKRKWRERERDREKEKGRRGQSNQLIGRFPPDQPTTASQMLRGSGSDPVWLRGPGAQQPDS